MARPANYWRNRAAVIASGLTAWAVAGWLARHEGPLAMPSGCDSSCGPDDLPTVAFLVIWPATYRAYAVARDYLTGSGVSSNINNGGHIARHD